MRRVVFNMHDERPAWAPPPWVLDRLREGLPAGFQLVDVRSPVTGRGDGGGVSDEALAAVRGAEVYLGLGLPRELLLAALKEPGGLRWVHTGAAGVGSLLHPELVQRDIVLTNSAGIHAEPMAETVLAMMLHFSRGIDYAVAAQRRRSWDTASYERVDSGVRELNGATVGIIGYGGIGRAVARRARALGMTALALRRRAEAEPDDQATILTGADALPQLLSGSDIVVVCLPATAETRGLLGAAELAQMREGAVLINVARGGIIDEAALLLELESGRLRGAALDVFSEEPLPPESPLWDAPRLLILPHVSATTPHFWDRQAMLILDNLDRYAEGRPLRNVVDPTAGY
jgi:phosphoglycerate dehydrogenase-like enzyme